MIKNVYRANDKFHSYLNTCRIKNQIRMSLIKKPAVRTAGLFDDCLPYEYFELVHYSSKQQDYF
jgi:hypothetical protein